MSTFSEAEQRYAPVLSRARDRHLFAPGPKRVLALDGGGIRGLISLGILLKIESTLRARRPPSERDTFVLSDYFDLICGTSTGSIIAAWLARGNSVRSTIELYNSLGPKVFSYPSGAEGAVRRTLGLVIVSRFNANVLKSELLSRLRDETLDSDALVTGLGVTAKRMDSGSAWVLTNNPRAPYWASLGGSFPNRDYKLSDVVRASAAAPAYFDHVEVQIEPGKDPGAFMDGAVAGLNNPSLAFLQYVLSPNLGLRWRCSPDDLLIVNVGTGRFRNRHSARSLSRMRAVERALHSLAGSISDVSHATTATMQALARTQDAAVINSEVGTLNDLDLGHGAGLFRYQRYDAPLDQALLQSALRLEYTDGVVRRLHRLDNAEQANLDRLNRIGVVAGEAFVKPHHFPGAFD